MIEFCQNWGEACGELGFREREWEQPPQGSFFGSRTPLDSVGTQMHAVWRGLEAKHPLELMRSPEEAPQAQI